MNSKILIKTGNDNYSYHIGESALSLLPSIIKKDRHPGKILVIVDANVFKHHSHKIKSVIKKTNIPVHYYLFKASEKNKSLKSAEKIFSILKQNKFGKDSLIISIGGGITGDLSGFAASTYMRGIDIIHVATTIVSALDSSIGGKTAVNFLETKNLIGTYQQPKAVITDLSLIKSLPKKEVINGLGEVIKYAFLAGNDLYIYIDKKLDAFKKLELVILKKIIIDCIKIKSGIVSIDEKDTGIRKMLNFGHTFAHAFESAANYQIKHGEAVAAGIICAIFLSFKKRFINQTELNKLLKLPAQFHFSKRFLNIKSEDIFEFMKLDKKNVDGKVRFVLIKNPGEILLDIAAEKKEISFAIKNFKRNFVFKRGKTVEL